jgi:hypothetical protein
VRDHRQVTNVIVRDHRKEPIVRDHRKEPIVRDHRKPLGCYGNVCRTQ